MFKDFRTSFNNTYRNVVFTLKTFWQIDKSLFFLSVAIYASRGLIPVLQAYLVGRLIDVVAGAITSPAVDGVPMEAVVLLAVISLVHFIYTQSWNVGSYVTARMQLVFSHHFADQMMRIYHNLDHEHYESTELNKLINKVNTNINVMTRTPERVFSMLMGLFQLAAIASTLVLVNAGIVLLLIIGFVPLGITLMNIAQQRWKVSEEVDQEERLQNEIANTATSLREISELKIFNISDYFRDLWSKFYWRTRLKRIDVEKRGLKKMLWSDIFSTVIVFGVNIWLLLRVIGGAISLGNFEFFRRLISDFTSSSARLVGSFQDLNESSLYIEDYQRLCALKPAITIPPNPKTIGPKEMPSIEFDNVSFRYPGSDNFVLQNLSMKIAPAENIAIVGANGAGKTTLVKLLLRFYDVTHGKILINGTDIKELDLESWYRHIGVLFQDFNRYAYFKVWRSIGIGNIADIEDKDGIKRAAEKAGADGFIQEMPFGYETVLSKAYDHGVDISGGQWQRMALSRAFFRDASVLILDEPTAAVDSKAEQEIFNTINQTQKDKTTIIISHRFSTVRNADTIYVIDSGEIAESGSHDDLVAKNGVYKELFEAQAEGYR